MSARGDDEMTRGAVIGGRAGAVVRAEHLTVVVGDHDRPFVDGTVPLAALALVRRIASEATWGFDVVADALQRFVVAHGPAGVAALLEGPDGPIVFLFDEAEAIELDADHSPAAGKRPLRGVGRSGWTTELVDGPIVQLRLGSSGVVGWTRLGEGVVAGSSAEVTLARTDADDDAAGSTAAPDETDDADDDPEAQDAPLGARVAIGSEAAGATELGAEPPTPSEKRRLRVPNLDGSPGEGLGSLVGSGVGAPPPAPLPRRGPAGATPIEAGAAQLPPPPAVGATIAPPPPDPAVPSAATATPAPADDGPAPPAEQRPPSAALEKLLGGPAPAAAPPPPWPAGGPMPPRPAGLEPPPPTPAPPTSRSATPPAPQASPPPPDGRPLGVPLGAIASAAPPPPPATPDPSDSPPSRAASSPIVAYLIEDDPAGTMHPIVGTTVVGSDPGDDPEVMIGAATMITIDDPTVHEAQVRLRVRGRQVTVEDTGFGGTWLQSGNGPMKPIHDAGEQVLLPGSQLRLGSRTLVFRNATSPVG